MKINLNGKKPSYSEEVLRSFEFFAFFFVVIQFVHLVSLVLGFVFPFSFLYGPILYAMAMTLQKGKHFSIKTFTLHLVPFLFFQSWYTLSSLVPGPLFYQWCFPVALISSFGYSILVFVKMKNRFRRVNDDQILLVKQLAGLGIGISSFVSFIYWQQLTTMEFDTKPMVAVTLAMLFCILLLVNFIYQQRKIRKDIGEEESIREVSVVFAEEQKVRFTQIIDRVMDHDQLYLNPNLTLSELSKETTISKSDLSEFINICENSTYYEWLAKYRIQYALNLLESTVDQLKMEAVATESGFNSKTVFYRYFKQYVGVSPSEYRSKLVNG